MPKIVIIGAGSVMFTRQMLSSLFSHESLGGATVVLEDVNPAILDRTLRLVRLMVAQNRIKARVTATTDQKKALRGADFVICAIQAGGLEAWRLDMDIPKKYGVIQEVGDTLGPGGVFRALRHIGPMLSILRDMEKLCPEALFINKSNPLAPLVWAARKASPITSIGLCYGVTYTVAQLAGYLGIGPWVDHPHSPEAWARLMYSPVPEGVEFTFGGINHMSWILSLKYQGRDMYPEIRTLPENPEVMAADGVRCEILRHFGLWSTENHWHFTDYVPYFRKNEETINRFLPRRWDLLNLERRVHAAGTAEIEAQLAGEKPVEVRRNVLNAPRIIQAMVSGQTVRVNANLPNNGLVANLPAECMVEVPVYVDGTGLHPVAVGSLPRQCAALCASNVSVQGLVVEAALEKRPEAALYALSLDPVTAAVCTLDQIRDMFEELRQAQRPWLGDWMGTPGRV
ncbi:alpha-galactosidase [Desulfolutivibrio sp.]|uniref:alpha-galactosidase n=1 Tax=Desulfolutivibrio sp. TaxID=2773296 RepID=UPI002F96CD04